MRTLNFNGKISTTGTTDCNSKNVISTSGHRLPERWINAAPAFKLRSIRERFVHAAHKVIV